MEVEIAKTAGYCFGVKRAVNIIEDLLARGVKTCTLGPIIHNSRVIKSFEDRGVITVKEVDSVPNGYVVVIRSHGISKEVMKNIMQRNLIFVDATCPFVKKIHKIIEKESNLGKIILIAGDKNHPEVEGVKGYCSGKPIIFKDHRDLRKMIKTSNISRDLNTVLVGQTTFDIKEWKKCENLTKILFANLRIYDTICNTTQLRQKEAKNLSKKSDCMIVIGDKKSSNTDKLYNICRHHCNTFFVQSKYDLNFNCFSKCRYIGITAGASTPEEIIREVAGVMLDNTDVDNKNDSSFEELLEESFKEKSYSKRVKGTVVNITPTEVYVDIGRKQSGIIPLSELTRDSDAKPEDIVKVGDELDLLIIKVNDQEGTVTLSKIKVESDKDWDKIVSLYDDNKVLTGTVCKLVKSGLLLSYENLNVFIPSSHIGGNKNIPLESYLDKEVKFKIIEVDKYKKRIVGSIREVIEEEKDSKLKEFWNNIEIGKIYKGVVRSITSYAVFVDIGCIDGMVHISELSWDRTKEPSEIVSIGQEIEVKVKSFDKEKGRVALSYKKAEDSPWGIIEKDYPVGKVFEAEIVNILPFGAFARVIPGVDGLIHISQMSDRRIESPNEVMSLGDKVKVKIRDIDEVNKRVSLTMRDI